MHCAELFREIYNRDPDGLAFCPYRISPLGAHIAPAGWDDWGKPHGGLRFEEYASSGPGAVPGARPEYVRFSRIFEENS